MIYYYGITDYHVIFDYNMNIIFNITSRLAGNITLNSNFSLIWGFWLK